MKLKVLGMSARDAIAFDMFMQKSMTGWHWEHLLVASAMKWADADILIVDMAAHGWAHGNDANLAQLKQLVGHQPAVLLISAQDHTWSRLMSAWHVSQWTWLAKPYGAQRMREVLTQIKSTQNTSHLKASSMREKALPAKEVAAEVHEEIHTRIAGSPSVSALSPDALATQLSRMPLDRYTLLRRMLNGIQTQIPFEMRFTVQNSLIVNPENDWIATNTPVQVITRVCDSNALAKAVTVRELDLSEAQDRAHRLGMEFKDLNIFLQEVSAGLSLQKTVE